MDTPQVNILIHEAHHNLGMGGITTILVVYFENSSRSCINDNCFCDCKSFELPSYESCHFVSSHNSLVWVSNEEISKEKLWYLKRAWKNKLASSLIGVGLIPPKVSYLDVIYTYMHNNVFYLGTNVNNGSPYTFDANPMEMQQDNPKGAELWAP